MNLPWGFRAIGYHLVTGEQRHMEAQIPADVPDGRYRIRKALLIAPGAEHSAAEPLEVTVEFNVVRP